MKRNRKRILIVDPPDRRVVPTLGSIGKEYDFHILIPIRRDSRVRKFAETALKIFRPRYTRSIAFVPFGEERELRDGIIEFLNKNQMDAVLAFSERSTAILLSLRSSIEDKVKVPFGSLDHFVELNDKYLISQIARESSIPTPDFRLIQSDEDLFEASELGFPVVLKCCRASGVNEALRVCHNYEQLNKAYHELVERNRSYSFFPCDKLVAQTFLHGKIYDGCFAVKEGKIVAAMTQIRKLTIPPSGGVGAYNITKRIPEIIEYGKRIFERIPWTGPAQLEFILDTETQEYKLIEINPRFWGTLALSIKAGVNFPKYVLEIGLDGKFPPPPLVEDGIDFSWLLQETLMAEILQGKGKSTVIRHFLRIFSSEINNFSYSFIINLILSIPFIVSAIMGKEISSSNEAQSSLASRLFS